jgi:hypothetical protein
MTRFIAFKGNPPQPDLANLAEHDRQRLDSLITLAHRARTNLGMDEASIRKTFDRISAIHRFSLANAPINPDGEALHGEKAIEYWGDFVFAEAARRPQP